MLDIDTFSHFIEDNNLIEKKDRIVLGVSGGADSICLLHTLSRIQKALEIRLFVVHINHGIRGEEASRDENYVKKFCEKLDICFFSFHYDIPRIAKDLKLSEEEAGRKMRYESFENVSKDTRDMQKRSGGQADKRRRKSMDTRNRRRTRKIRFGSQRFRRCVHERR